MTTKIPVIAVFDIGENHKKLLLFDENYSLQYEIGSQLEKASDEAGFPCEDLEVLLQWMKDAFDYIRGFELFEIRGLNFCGYGASMVLLDKNLQPLLPIENFRKPYPEKMEERFYENYGGEELIGMQTASPAWGNRNSGKQLYRLKHEKPAVFNRVKTALHLPQFLSFRFSNQLYTDLTSIGGHTGLWNFKTHQYHQWVKKEDIHKKFPPVVNSDEPGGYLHGTIPVGVGLLDSAAVLIPYQHTFADPFILVSTGRSCITFNPFNEEPLSIQELRQGCFYYFSMNGSPVKASCLFEGEAHEKQVKMLADYFNKPRDYYRNVKFDQRLYRKLKPLTLVFDADKSEVALQQPDCDMLSPASFSSYEEAYHQLMKNMVERQVFNINLVYGDRFIKRLFVDGEFGKNKVYMNLLARALPEMEVFSTNLPHAAALGAALAIHPFWNSKPVSTEMVDLKLYSPYPKNKVERMQL